MTYDSQTFSDYVWDYACEAFNTDNPTDEQIEKAEYEIMGWAEAQADLTYDAWREEQMLI